MADLCGTQAAVMLVKSEDGASVLSDGGRLQTDVIDTLVSVKDEVCYSQLLQGILSLPPGYFPDEDTLDNSVQTQNDTVNTVQNSLDMCLLPHTTLIGPEDVPRDINDREILSNAIVCESQMLSTEVDDKICRVENVPSNGLSLDQNTTLSRVLGTIKSEVEDYHIGLVGEGTISGTDYDRQLNRLNQKLFDDVITDELDHIVLKDRREVLLSRSILEKEKSSTEMVLRSVPDDILNSSLPSFVKVKDEALESNNFHSLNKGLVDQISPNKVQTVKSEWENPGRLFRDDEIDHMPLIDRMKLLTSGESSNPFISREYECYSTTGRSHSQYDPVFTESIKPVTIKLSRKRKKTATDSIEIALDEDAPGLLQVLIDKGISVDEIRLYGEPESDDLLDDSTNEFSELEAVIAKDQSVSLIYIDAPRTIPKALVQVIFWKRQSLLKLAPIKCTKDSKITYCLACLISLVEQTRYLHFRKWPVEWGWCRDLQSFIFVFQRHNRIVLERPEYGYATYFFELINSLPIDWQIKRLVTAMKLTNCSRINLIENKTLTVGEDLTEGEAKVLAGYGWIPDTGLGSMLNYRDRVFHDRNSVNIKDSSEWRSKIGKLLMDGYDGGTIVLTDIPKKVVEYRGTLITEIKSEL